MVKVEPIDFELLRPDPLDRLGIKIEPLDLVETIPFMVEHRPAYEKPRLPPRLPETRPPRLPETRPRKYICKKDPNDVHIPSFSHSVYHDEYIPQQQRVQIKPEFYYHGHPIPLPRYYPQYKLPQEKSQVKGVTYDKTRKGMKKWRARIVTKSHKKSIGWFASRLEAEKAMIWYLWENDLPLPVKKKL